MPGAWARARSPLFANGTPWRGIRRSAAAGDWSERYSSRGVEVTERRRAIADTSGQLEQPSRLVVCPGCGDESIHIRDRSRIEDRGAGSSSIASSHGEKCPAQRGAAARRNSSKANATRRDRPRAATTANRAGDCAIPIDGNVAQQCPRPNHVGVDPRNVYERSERKRRGRSR